MFDGISSRQAIPATRLLSHDINALQGRLRQLQDMQREIRKTPALIIMGPGSHGRDALNAYGVAEVLAGLIQSYEMAIGDLSDQHTEADIAECARQVFTLHGKARAEVRRYLLEAIEEYKLGTRRAAA